MAKVRALMSGAGTVPVLESLYATENGNYTPPTGVDGFDDVTVAVPPPVIITKSISVNGTYNAVDDHATGYSSVVVSVPPSGLPKAECNYSGLSYAYLSVDGDLYLGNVKNISGGYYTLESGHTYLITQPATVGNRFRIAYWNNKTFADDFEQFIDTPGSATLVMNHDVLVGAYDSDTLKRVIYTPSAPGVLVVGTDNVGNVIIPYVIDITNY